MNILYLGDINSIHDFKWISFFSLNKDYKTYFFTEIENHELLNKEWEAKLEEANITILPPIPSFSLNNPFKTLRAISTIKKYLKEYNIDAFHVLFGSPQPIWFNFLPASLKKLVTTRGSDVLVLLKEVRESKGIKNKLLYKLLLTGFKKANQIISTSDKQIAYLKDCGIPSSKLNVIKTGVDVDAIQSASLEGAVKTKKSKFIFSARYIGKVYNMDYQFAAIKKLPTHVLENYSFLFIKRKSDSSEFTSRFIEQLNNIKGLSFDVCEDLTQEQLWGTLKASSLTYMVPISDGTPNTALECMAGEVPFIMGDLDYNKELFSDVCVVVKLSDPQDFTNKVESALNEYPSELKSHALNIVRKFGDRKSEMSKLKALYDQLNG